MKQQSEKPSHGMRNAFAKGSTHQPIGSCGSPFSSFSLAISNNLALASVWRFPSKDVGICTHDATKSLHVPSATDVSGHYRDT